MFSSAILKIEPALISNFTFTFLMVAGYLLNKLRRWGKVIILLGLTFISLNSWSFMYVPGSCGTACMNNRQHYTNYYRTSNQCFPNTWRGVQQFPQYNPPFFNQGNTNYQIGLYRPYGPCYNCPPRLLPTSDGNTIIRN